MADLNKKEKCFWCCFIQAIVLNLICLPIICIYDTYTARNKYEDGLRDGACYGEMHMPQYETGTYRCITGMHDGEPYVAKLTRIGE